MTEPQDPRDVDVLACGRPVEELVDQADAGRLEPVDSHQAGCPYCRRALQDAATSIVALDLLRSHRTAAPAGLVDKVLRNVRRLQPAPARLDLPAVATGVPGRIRVSQQLLATVARVAAASQPGVTVTSASTAALPSRATSRLAEVSAGLRVNLAVLVDGSTPLPEVASAIRWSVRTALRLAVGTVDLQIELTALDLVPRSGRT